MGVKYDRGNGRQWLSDQCFGLLWFQESSTGMGCVEPSFGSVFRIWQVTVSNLRWKVWGLDWKCVFFSESLLTSAGIVKYFVTLDLLSTSSTYSYSIIRRPNRVVIRCYTPHTFDKAALNQESANWESVAPTALFDVCHKEYFQCFDRISKLDCPVRNHWQNDRAYCLPLRGMNVGVLLYNPPEVFQTCSAIQVPQPRVWSAPQSPPSQRQTSQSHAS